MFIVFTHQLFHYQQTLVQITMNKLGSVLCDKICLCRTIDTLADEECFQVIQLIQNELSCNKLSDLLRKMIFEMNDSITNNIINHLQTEINRIKAKANEEKIEKPTKLKKINNSAKQAQDNNNNIKFKLLRLPNDLIHKTSLFLDEKDIFSFEICNRYFYIMINNLNYLNQTNNFKHFYFTNNRLKQLVEISKSKQSFSYFKFSKCNQFTIDIDCNASGYMDIMGDFWGDDGNGIYKYDRLRYMARQVEILSIYMDEFDKDNWLINALGNIKTLSLIKGGDLVGDDILEILFDKAVSQLEVLEICESTQDFESRYVVCRSNLVKKGTMKTLSCVHQKRKTTGKNGQNSRQSVRLWTPSHLRNRNETILRRPIYIDTRHMYFYHGVDSDWFYKAQWYCPNLVTLTFENCDIHLHDDYLQNINTRVKNDDICICDPQIVTLRVINVHQDENCAKNIGMYDMNILNNELIINRINLCTSVENVTVQLNIDASESVITSTRFVTGIETTILHLLKKEYFHNLKNVNMLFCSVGKWERCQTTIDRVFKVLKENKRMLKYQFKQFNVGFYRSFDHGENENKNENENMKREMYKVLQWNQNIDDKILDTIRLSLMQMNQTHQEMHQNKEAFSLAQNQWC